MSTHWPMGFWSTDPSHPWEQIFKDLGRAPAAQKTHGSGSGLLTSALTLSLTSDADVEDEAEEPTMEHEWEGTQKDESEHAEEETKEASEIEVSAHDLYEFRSQSNFMTMMMVKPLAMNKRSKMIMLQPP